MVKPKKSIRKAQNSRFSRNSRKPMTKALKKLRREAMSLLSDPKFFSRLSDTIARIGVVGERRTALLLFLASLTTQSSDPVSVMVKGPSSSGKSNVVKAVLSLLPPEMVVDRASLSSKALAHGEVDLRGRILYLAEVRGGKEGQFLLRLLQSEGNIKHEYTYVQGRSRGTEVVERTGKPVVITTTTEDRVFEDDETRFLSIWVDTSEKQTLEIARSLVRKNAATHFEDMQTVREAIRILSKRRVSVELPSWFETVADKIPRGLRTRRDFRRLISLVRTVALIQSMSDARRSQSDLPPIFSPIVMRHSPGFGFRA